MVGSVISVGTGRYNRTIDDVKWMLGERMKRFKNVYL